MAMRRLTAWLLYWLGDLASKVMEVPGMAWVYFAYCRIMGASVIVQGEGAGPWEKVHGHT